MRDKSIDYMKGLLVLGMVLAHVIQFFYNGDGYKHPFSTFINQVTFSSFIFCFGYAFYIAYLSKELKKVFYKMVIGMLKCVAAFYISGIAFRMLFDHAGYSWNNLRKIIIFEDLPGWSEFLAAFAVVNLVGIVLYLPLKKLLDYPVVYWCVTGLLLLTTFIPYELVKVNQLGLLIGTKNFSCFPAIQYFPFFMIGIYFAKKEIKIQVKYMVGALLITVGCLFYVKENGLPERFPPTLMWLLLPVFYIYLYYIAGHLLSKLESKIKLFTIIEDIGSKSLFYLVISNLIIFAFSGARMGRFMLPGCFIIAVIIISIIYYLNNISKDKVKKIDTGGHYGNNFGL